MWIMKSVILPMQTMHYGFKHRVWNFVRSALNRTRGVNSTFWASSWGVHSSLHFDRRLYKYSTHVVVHWLISDFGYGMEIYLCAEVFIGWNFSHWQHQKLSCEQFPRVVIDGNSTNMTFLLLCNHRMICYPLITKWHTWRHCCSNQENFSQYENCLLHIDNLPSELCVNKLAHLQINWISLARCHFGSWVTMQHPVW